MVAPISRSCCPQHGAQMLFLPRTHPPVPTTLRLSSGAGLARAGCPSGGRVQHGGGTVLASSADEEQAPEGSLPSGAPRGQAAEAGRSRRPTLCRVQRLPLQPAPWLLLSSPSLPEDQPEALCQMLPGAPQLPRNRSQAHSRKSVVPKTEP